MLFSRTLIEAEPPALEHNAYSDSSSDDDAGVPARGSSSGSDSAPPVARRAPTRRTAPASSAAPRQQTTRSNPPPAPDSDSDKSSEGSSIPGLMPRNEGGVSDEDDSDELPELVNRGGGGDVPNRARDAPSSRSSRTRAEPQSSRPSARSSTSAPRPAASVSAPRRATGTASRVSAAQERKKYQDAVESARAKANKMKPSQLKKDLRKMGINPDQMIEKKELIEAYAEAKAKRDQSDGAGRDNRPSTRTEPPPVPVDPLADLPGLLAVNDPPDNGAWIQTPKSTSVDELSYIFLQNGELRSQTIPVFHSGYSYSVFANYDGFAFIHGQSGGRHEIYRRHCSEVVNHKVFDIEVPSDTTVEMTSAGTGSLYLLYPENSQVESTWKLVYRNHRIPKPETLLSNLPFSTRMHSCSSGCVWLDIGHSESGASSEDALAAGIWYISRWESKHVLTSDDLPDEENRFITIDAKRNGMWVIRPVGDADSETCVLIHVDRHGNKREQVVEIAFKLVQAMVNAGIHRDGVFLHFKTLDRWKLGVVTFGKSVVEEFCDCARTSQIVSCGWGGVWLWKKAGRQRTFTLSYVDQEKKTHDYGNSFHRDAVLVGLHDQT